MQNIGSRVIYAGVILFAFSLLLFTLFLFSFIKEHSVSATLPVNQVLKRIFALLLAVLAVRGGIQLLLRKNAGWIVSFSILCLLSGIIVYGLLTNTFSGEQIISALVIEFLLILAVVFLLSRRTLKKFSFRQKNITPVLLLTGSLTLLYIFIQ